MNANSNKILSLLTKNARISNLEIAQRLAISENEVAAAIKEMEDDGVIIGYTTLTDPTRESGQVRAMIEVQVQPERDEGFDKVAGRLAKFDEVVSMKLVSGRYDLCLEVVGESLQEVAYFVARKLSTQPGVKSTSTLFMLKKYKESGILLEKDEEYERLKICP